MSRTISSWIVIVGGALIAIGSLLPWVTITTTAFFALTISRSAFQLGDRLSDDGTGPIVMIVALLVVGLGVALLNASPHGGPTKTTIATSAVALLILVLTFPTGLSSGAGVASSIGVGYYLCAIGAAAAIFGAISRHHARLDGAISAVSASSAVESEGKDQDDGELGYVCSQCGSMWVKSYDGLFCADCGAPLKAVE
jgi:hypothetical protein